MIFDEPTANLSVTATKRLLETMLELKTPRRRPGHHLASPDRHFRGRRPRDGAEARRATSATAKSPLTVEREVLELIVSGVPEDLVGVELAS